MGQATISSSVLPAVGSLVGAECGLISSNQGDFEACSHCSVSHAGFFNYFHYEVTACSMEAHTRLSDSPAGPSADEGKSLFLKQDNDHDPNPPLQSLLMLGHSDTAAIILSQRHSEMPEIADRMAALILMYRLLKWRLHPTPARLTNVPAFYRPTPTQLQVPHPVTIDFLAFPDLRDALIREDSAYVRADPEMVDRFDRDFLMNLTAQWPPLQPLVVRTSAEVCARGEPRFKLNPSLEAHCLKFEN